MTLLVAFVWFGILAFYWAGWDKAYKKMCAGGPIFPVLPWVAGYPLLYFGGVIAVAATASLH